MRGISISASTFASAANVSLVGIQEIERIEAVSGQRPRRVRVHPERIDDEDPVVLRAPLLDRDGGVLTARIVDENVRLRSRFGMIAVVPLPVPAAPYVIACVPS